MPSFSALIEQSEISRYGKGSAANVRRGRVHCDEAGK
jgi:hypothetical protein